MTSLGPRLQAIADAVLPGFPIADVGTDHALLVAHLIRSGAVPHAIASDRARGPLAVARRTLGHVCDRVRLRRADGLHAMRPGEVATVVIAGMGACRIRRILEAGSERLRGVRRLVLQPNNQWPEMRQFIRSQHWTLVDERLVQERGKFYLVLVVDPIRRGLERSWTPEDEAFGPVLRRRRDPMFARWLAHERTRLEQARNRAADGRDPDDARLDRLHYAIDMIRAEL